MSALWWEVFQYNNVAWVLSLYSELFTFDKCLAKRHLLDYMSKNHLTLQIWVTVVNMSIPYFIMTSCNEKDSQESECFIIIKTSWRSVRTTYIVMFFSSMIRFEASGFRCSKPIKHNREQPRSRNNYVKCMRDFIMCTLKMEDSDIYLFTIKHFFNILC